MNFYEESLLLHEKYRGKLKVEKTFRLPIHQEWLSRV